MSLTKHELKSTLVVSLIFSLRLMGLFILLPIFSIYASEYNNSSAFLAGIAMSKTKTAICHSISYPLTSLYDLPHGIACSLTLPNICQLNMKQYPERTMIISRAMGCSNKNLERSLIDFFKSLKYKNYLKPIKKKDIDDSINFINPARSKNSLVEISNNHAVKIVKSSIKKFITS